MYKDLLEFYFKTVTLFRASAFVLRIAVEMLKPEMPEIISSFKEHADVLSKLLESETFATVQEIKDELVDALSKYIHHLSSSGYLLHPLIPSNDPFFNRRII